MPAVCGRMHAYSMGLIYWWSRLASLMPGIANFFTQTPGISDAVKADGRDLGAPTDAAVCRPRLSRNGFAARPPRNVGATESHSVARHVQ